MRVGLKTMLADKGSDVADCPAAIEAIGALLAKGELAQAEGQLHGALQQWPGEIRLYALHADCLTRSDRVEEARAVYARAIELFPRNPWPGIWLVRSLLDAGAIEDACATFRAQVWRRDEPDATGRHLLNELSTSRADPQWRRRFLESLLQGKAQDRFVLAKLAILAFRAHDKTEATRLFDAASALGPLPDESGILRIDLLIAANRFDEAHVLAGALHSRRPDRVDLVRKVIQTAHFSNRTDELVALLRPALARWPGDWFLLFRYNRCTVPFAVDRELFDGLSAVSDQYVADERWCFQFVLACLRHQHSARALELLDELTVDGPVAHMSEPLRRALAVRPGDAWSNPRNLSNDPADDVQVRRRPDAQATVVVMAGVQGGLGYLPYSYADVVLSDYPVNVVYLRDQSNRTFLDGVRGLGADEAATIAALRLLLAELGGQPAITVGMSVGGVAATRYGMLAGAYAVISLAGPVHLRDSDDEDHPASRTNYRGAMYAAMNKNDDSLIDLIAHSPETRLYQCYGTGYPPDVATAELLRHLPNVTLEPVPDCADHFVAHHMIANGSFDALLRRIIEGCGSS